MTKPIRLSYSSLKQYESCPRQYNWQRIERRPRPQEESRHNAMTGTVIQATFEHFYKNEIWRMGPDASKYLQEVSLGYLDKFLAENLVNWDDPSCRFTLIDVRSELFRMIPATVQTIKRERLLGPYAQSEIPIELYMGKDILLGNLDFVIRTTDDKVWIFDGKATKHREERVDPDQLYFYALLFYLRWQYMPDRLGFLYYWYTDQPEKAMDWIPVDVERVHAIKDRAEKAIAAMRRNEWQPNPTPSNCKYCAWELSCKERQEQKAINSAKRKKNTPELPTPDDNGLIGF